MKSFYPKLLVGMLVFVVLLVILFWVVGSFIISSGEGEEGEVATSTDSGGFLSFFIPDFEAAAPQIPKSAVIKKPTSDKPQVETPVEEEEEEIDPTISPWKDMVTIRKGTAATEQRSAYEYIIITARSNNPEPINITGWTLENAGDQKMVREFVRGDDDQAVWGEKRTATIGKGIKILQPPAIREKPSDIYLEPGVKAIITTGSSPEGSRGFYVDTNFQLTKCSGYLTRWFQTIPALPMRQCPRPSSYEGVNVLEDSCYNYIRKLRGCVRPTDSSISELTEQCQDFIRERFNYSACVINHKDDPNFFLPEWRIFLNRGHQMWDRTRESIILKDKEGRVVNQISY
ncbi:MAG: hypothetical protein ACOCU8_03510 [Patescibacteria group bacterium]